MAQHLVVGIGFFAGPFLLAHFFPPNESGLEVCSDNASVVMANASNAGHVDISAPFSIIAVMIGLAGLGYLLLLCLPFPMPGRLTLL
jgi:hypothetical protein